MNDPVAQQLSHSHYKNWWLCNEENVSRSGKWSRNDVPQPIQGVRVKNGKLI